MKKYYIGLIVLFILTAGLLGYTVRQGGLAKKDKVIATKAQEASEKLNNYVGDKGKIPATLSEAGINNVPDGIKYTKVSDERYTFCVTYNAASRGYGVGATELATAALISRFYGVPGYDQSGFENQENSALYVYDFSHKKGETCYKVKPYLYNSTLENNYCDPNGEFYSYTKSLCATDGTLDPVVN